MIDLNDATASLRRYDFGYFTDANCSAALSFGWAETSDDGVVAYFRGYETPENRIYWWIVDYICDVIYILDIVLVKRRLRFINNGMVEVRAPPTAFLLQISHVCASD